LTVKEKPEVAFRLFFHLLPNSLICYKNADGKIQAKAIGKLARPRSAEE
jgi:hypothetical protein